MKYYFAPFLLLRMPVNNPAEYAKEMQTFLYNDFFLAAIRNATPTFYSVLERQDFQSERLSLKEKYTLQKYINRYCFRPTPFGLFSSISLVRWINQAEENHPSKPFSTYVRAAMPVQHMLANYLLEHHIKQQARFEGNPSIYRVLNEYRFFRSGLDDSGKHREYQLQSIAFSKLLKDLLQICVNGSSRDEIVRQIAKLAECRMEEAGEYTDFLIDAQLLIPTDRMTITGKDYLTRLTRKLERQLPKNFGNISCGEGNEINITHAFQIAQLENGLQSLFPEKELPEDKLSVILKRNGPAEPLGPDCQHKLRDGIAALELLSSIGLSESMSQFINSFQRHFEGQTLPLLQALDPEAGIGYQPPETEKNNPLLETLHIPYRSQSRLNGYWSPAHSILLERWLKEKPAQVIKLTESDLDFLNTREQPAPMLGMSVLFRVIENKVFIENAGGINAPALMGRFTLVDNEIAKAAQMMAHELESKNPGIIFAEILHLADPHTDNVNRRAHIYQFELPITAASDLPAEKQLQLSDLYIRIIDNKVMLFSKRHQKFVIPRLTSAYNHSLNKLPLFRFLADLPYQYGRSYLGLDLRQLFPGLHFYPRIEYKGTILCLAIWIITEKQIQDLLEAAETENTFTALSNAIQLPRYFSLTEGDQELVFDGQNMNDILFFCSCIRLKKDVVLKEFPEQPEVRQYNAYLLPEDPLVFLKPAPIPGPKGKPQRKFVPGSSWLYLKVYAPRIGVDRLLLRLAPLLRKNYGGHKITQWFFIRYEDYAPHIRLRLQVNPDSISDVLLSFKTKLEDRIQQHVIREFQIDVYSRELERYAAGSIENSERFFWASSELVLHYLKYRKTGAIISTHAFALYSMFVIIEEFITEADAQLIFTLTSFQQFLPEFTVKPFKADLDRKYRELSAGINSAFQSNDRALLSGSLKAGLHFRQTLPVIKKQLGAAPDLNYLRSIIHMHLNRIFTDESRKQEMICYYLLNKYLLSVKGRNKRKNDRG